MIDAQFGKLIHCLRSNNGMEYVNYTCLNAFSGNGNAQKLTCVDTPWQNNIFERKTFIFLKWLGPFFFKW